MANALIIDDESDICFLLSSILKNKGFKTDFVNSLAEATTALKKDKPSIVFLDNHLPDGMGIDFIGYIKQNNPESKIVMITAYDNNPDRIKALDSGADYFLGKPFTRDSIYQTIDNLKI